MGIKKKTYDWRSRRSILNSLTTINEDDFKYTTVGKEWDSHNHEYDSFSYLLYKNNEDITPILENTFKFGDYAVLGVDNKKGRIYSHSVVYKYSPKIYLDKYKDVNVFHDYGFVVDRDDVDQRTLPNFEGNYIKFLKNGLYLVELFYMMYKYYNVNIGSTMVFPNRNDIYTQFTNENELTLFNTSIQDTPEAESNVYLKKCFPMLVVIEVKNGQLKILPEFEPKLDFKLKVKKGSQIVEKTYPFTYNRATITTNENHYFYKNDNMKLNFNFSDFVYIENNLAKTKLIQTVQAEDWWGNNNDIFFKLMLGQLVVYKLS